MLFLMIEANHIFHVRALIQRNPQLLNQQNDLGHTPLHYAAFFGPLAIAPYFIDEGAHLDVYTPKATGKYENITCPNQTAVDIACQRNNTAMVTLLFEAGATAHDVHTRFNNKTLTKHIEDNDFLSVQILIKSNPALLNRLNDAGYAPLHDAVIYGQTGMAAWFVF